MKDVPDSAIKIPADVKLAFVCEVQQVVETGDHFLHICAIKNIYGDENKDALFAWNGFGKAAPAEEKTED